MNDLKKLTQTLKDLNFNHNAIINDMKKDFDYSENNHPQIGIFWYDVNNNQLFGVNKMDEELAHFVKSDDGDMIKSYPKLHKNIWKKEQYREHKDIRFTGDYTLIPRGRVSKYQEKGFVVFVGDWIDKYPSVKKDILYEFELPPDTTFVKDIHWNIGHGWSDEYI